MLPKLASFDTNTEWTWSSIHSSCYYPGNSRTRTWLCRIDGKTITFSLVNEIHCDSRTVKGNRFLSSDFVYYWEMKITETSKTRKYEKLLVGVETHSAWGNQQTIGHTLLSNSGIISNDGELQSYMPNFEFPVTIGVLLDLIDYRMWFFKDGHCTGITPFANESDDIIPIVRCVNGSHLTVQLDRSLKSRQRLLSSIIQEPTWKAESFFISETSKARWNWTLWKGNSETQWRRLTGFNNQTAELLLEKSEVGLLLGNEPLGELTYRWDIKTTNVRPTDYDMIIGVSVGNELKHVVGGRNNYTCFLHWPIWALATNNRVYRPGGKWNYEKFNFNGGKKSRVSVIFDGRFGTLTYFLDGRLIQQPFNNIRGKLYYPVILIYSRADDIIRIPFSCSIPTRGTLDTLEKRCMGTILKSLRHSDIHKLPIPECIKNNFDTFH